MENAAISALKKAADGVLKLKTDHQYSTHSHACPKKVIFKSCNICEGIAYSSQKVYRDN